MQTTPPKAVRATVLLLLLSFISLHFLHAQSSAQAGEEVLEFQHRKNPHRTFQILPGDRVRYPDPSRKHGPEQRGDVVSTTDNSITVVHPRKKTETVIDLKESRYVHRVHKKRKTWGSILVGLFTLIGTQIGTSYIYWFTLYGAPFLWNLLSVSLAIVFNPLSIILLGIAIPLLATATKKASRKRWRHRIRRVFVRNPQP